MKKEQKNKNSSGIARGDKVRVMFHDVEFEEGYVMIGDNAIFSNELINVLSEFISNMNKVCNVMGSTPSVKDELVNGLTYISYDMGKKLLHITGPGYGQHIYLSELQNIVNNLK